MEGWALKPTAPPPRSQRGGTGSRARGILPSKPSLPPTQGARPGRVHPNPSALPAQPPPQEYLPPSAPPPTAPPSVKTFSRFSPVDNPEEWPNPGSSPGHRPPKGLGPFLPFEPVADDPLPEPFLVPNQWSHRLADAVVPDPGAVSLPDVSPEDLISRAGQPRPIPIFRAEDMADPLRRLDYGRAGVTLRRTDERDACGRQRRAS